MPHIDPNPDPRPDAAARWHIRVHERIDARRAPWFGDESLRVEPQPDGTTLIDAAGLDQAALHGLLGRVRDAGLSLVSVTRVAR